MIDEVLRAGGGAARRSRRARVRAVAPAAVRLTGASVTRAAGDERLAGAIEAAHSRRAERRRIAGLVLPGERAAGARAPS